MDPIVIAIVIGALAGVVHQFMDRVKENDIKAFIRGAVIGAAAGLLTVVSLPSGVPDSTMYLSVFTAGYFGDSVILNIVERTKSQ